MVRHAAALQLEDPISSYTPSKENYGVIEDSSYIYTCGKLRLARFENGQSP